MIRETDTDPETLPFPDPATIDQTKANLSYFRKCAGYSQREAAAALGMSQANYWCFEVTFAVSNRATIISYRMLDSFAELFKCPVHLIDPAQPYNRDGRRFKSIYIEGELLHCVEHPVTDEDYSGNFRYFLGLSRMSIKEVAKKAGLSDSSVGKWRNGSTRYRGNNMLKAVEAMGFLEYRDLMIKPRRIAKGAPVYLRDGTELLLKVPAMCLADLKHNLNYHLHACGINGFVIDRMMHLQAGTTRRWMDPDSKSYMTPDQARVIANMHGFSEADISVTVLRKGRVWDMESAAAALPDSALNAMLHRTVNHYANLTDENRHQIPAEKKTVADYLNISSATASVSSMVAEDDSMFNYDTGEGIPFGALVIMEMSTGDISENINRMVCVRLNDASIAIRRLKRVSGVISLCTDNPEYQEHCVPMPDDAVIVGHVVGTVVKSV